MFDIGDKIVYPMHGAGVIVKKEEKDILGIKKEYFIFKMPVGEIKISIPVDKVNDVGIRTVVSTDIVDEVYSILSTKQGEVNANWNQRYKDNLEKLRTGDLYEISSVFKELYILDEEKGLSMAEKKLLTTSKKMLISEISVVKDKSASEIEDKILSLISL
ncbi:CarD family transcriptional regulator [Miniphocaeibacter massiliensis]|uniref:CarD family transcriptional regulator n=1 Tax=Miniphocaeibacter massiliensis TaxID=2041841 RepID=UPI000C088C81|nr:CarD family transcriptional regulator [Miniphocaeibacter massiliensis]